MNSPISASKNRAVIRRPITKSSPLRKSAPARVIIARSNSRSSQSSSYPNKHSTSSLRNPTYINDSTLIELRNRFYENPDFESVDNDTLQKLQAHLREYIQDRALFEDYDNAEKATSLTELIKQEISKRPNNNSSTKSESNSQSNNLESSSNIDTNNESDNESIQNADKEADTNSNTNSDVPNNDEKKRLSDFEEKWKNKFENFDQGTDQKIKELEEKQSSQLEEFEKIWSTEKPQKYRKASSQLLQLKKIERTLALSGQFDQARTIHSEAEKLAAKEQKELQTILIRDYRSAKENFLSKQRQEKQKLIDSRQETRSTMEIQKNAEYNKLLKRNVVVQDKLKEAQRGTMRERSGVIKPDYGTSVSNLNQNKAKVNDNIIPPLFAPNDPNFVEEDERRMREKRKKQLEFHKINADKSLLEYTVQPSPRGENDEDNANDQNSNEEKEKEKVNDYLDPAFSYGSNDNRQPENNNTQTNKTIDDTNSNQTQESNDYVHINIDFNNGINDQTDENKINNTNEFPFKENNENNIAEATTNNTDKDNISNYEESKPEETENKGDLSNLISICGSVINNNNN
ncbi:hypothetical protein M9Y10_002581 [Tritrichomonas musculus]|uniref:Uncharacterized protein n=1 Tax=Tritrichomonas musculus TaxID=1915356 RepID=A0ABR2LB52_9EUKA